MLPSIILRYIDGVLDRVTMYRLVLYVLAALLVAAGVESAFGLLPYAPTAILFSAVLAVAACWVVNEILSWFVHAAKSVESVYITAFILALILPPAAFGNAHAALVVVSVSAIAMASKYVLALQKKHIFNPAALGVFATGLFLHGYASWWVGGNLALLPFVLVGGLAIVRKIRRFDLVLTFFAFALGTMLVTTPSPDLLLTLWRGTVHTSLLFFAFVMLTEPLTMPPSRTLRMLYGALTGVLFAPAVHLFGIASSPELALLIGNAFSYIVSPKGRYLLKLARVEETSASTLDFVFHADRDLAFSAGQYLEWTLPHTGPDARGTRRYFTIASSPTEPEIRLGVKFYPKMSSFKQALARLKTGAMVTASQLGGEFTLPKDPKRKLVFIAGGIGVTPFRSHLRFLLDMKGRRDIVVLYGNRTPDDIAYLPLLEQSQEDLGTKVVHIVSEGAQPGMRSGNIDATVVREEVPDYRERLFYISGPQAMVSSVKAQLLELGVARKDIKTDYFIGLA